MGLGNLSVSHPREPWDQYSQYIRVHEHLDKLKGTAPGASENAPLYAAAKTQFDADAALMLVERIVPDAYLDELADWMVLNGISPRLVVPYPAYDDDDGIGRIEGRAQGPVNAIPIAYANYLSEKLGCDIDEEIVQAARVGRTKLKTWPRFLWQPSFTGEVQSGGNYLILDDVVTTGGTLAALRSYIIRSGGVVTGATALAHKYGLSQRFAVARETLDVLYSSCGQGLPRFWLEAIGHDIRCLTENEGQAIIAWARDFVEQGCSGDEVLQCLRDRLLEAAAKGR